MIASDAVISNNVITLLCFNHILRRFQHQPKASHKTELFRGKCWLVSYVYRICSLFDLVEPKTISLEMSEWSALSNGGGKFVFVLDWSGKKAYSDTRRTMKLWISSKWDIVYSIIVALRGAQYIHEVCVCLPACVYNKHSSKCMPTCRMNCMRISIICLFCSIAFLYSWCYFTWTVQLWKRIQASQSREKLATKKSFMFDMGTPSAQHKLTEYHASHPWLLLCVLLSSAVANCIASHRMHFPSM